MMEPAEIREPDAAGRHCRNRLFEWGMSLSTFLFGIHVSVFPSSLARSNFSPILDIVPAPIISVIAVIVGGMWLTALWCNGNWPVWGPVIRAVGSVVAGVILISIDVALLRQSYEVGRDPSPGTPFYSVFGIISLLIASRRAAADVRNRL